MGILYFNKINQRTIAKRLRHKVLTLIFAGSNPVRVARGRQKDKSNAMEK